MGTSIRWRGPRGAGWTTFRRSIGQLGGTAGMARTPEEIPNPRQGDGPISQRGVRTRGQRFFDALEEELRADPEAFGLRDTMRAGASRLVRAMNELRHDLAAFGPPPAEWTGSDTEWFMSEFVTAVAGERTGIIDAFVRRSATRCAEELLNDPRVRRAVAGQTRSSSLAMDLFCSVYRLFFADIVTEFAKAAVAEQVKLALPGLVLIDPGGQIPAWVGEQVASWIPNPCEQGKDDSDRSVADLAADLVGDNVDRALGLTSGTET
ncbi:hypothetical protein [Actinophytocola xinjiangensis]|nr:hypothetical protein [Actinophytocola xinjiangensis]